MWLRVGVVDAEADHPPRADPNDLGVNSLAGPTGSSVARCGLFRDTADLQAAHPPRIPRCDVIDNERDLVVGGDVAVLLALRHPVTADVDGLQVLVVGEPDRTDLRSAVGLDGRQPAKVTLAKVGDFVWL